MSERYTRLFSLPENLCAEGAPVVIAAGALSKDNETGKVFAQLKLHNIQSKAIQAVTVRLTPFDSAKRPLGEPFEYRYLDLSADGNADFGQKNPIVFPDPAARSFSVSVSEIIFTAGGIWTGCGESWEPFPPAVGLEKDLASGDLVRQFQIQYGENCKYVLQRERGLWRCSCGILNREDEQICLSCGNTAEILAAVDIEQLKTDCERRLESERQRAEKYQRKAEAERLASSRKMKIGIIAASIVVVAIFAIAQISSYMTKNSSYNSALALVEEGQYDEAIEKFTELGDFKDSEDQIELARNEREYSNAVKLLEDEDYDDAISAFKRLGDYKDSADLAIKAQETENESVYQEALSLLGRPVTEENNEGFIRARELLASLDGYADSADIVKELDEEQKSYSLARREYIEEGNVKHFIEVANTNKYLLVPEYIEALLNFFDPYIGNWEYLSGDASVLSYNSAEKNYTSIVVKLEFKEGIPVFVLRDKDKMDSRGWIIYFSMNLDDPENFQVETTNNLYFRANYSMELTPQDTLIISAETDDGIVTTCEYQRAAQE